MPEPDNTNWREEYKSYTSSKYELDLLDAGATSLSSSWVLGAMYQKWKKIKGIPPDPPPPDCSSSFKEWNDKIK
jgi:hypothetical protein